MYLPLGRCTANDSSNTAKQQSSSNRSPKTAFNDCIAIFQQFKAYNILYVMLYRFFK